MRDYSYLSEHVQFSGVNYWIADREGAPNGLLIQHYVNPDDMSEGTQSTVIAWPNLAAALWIMSEDAFVQYDGRVGELGRYHTEAARYLLAGPTWAADEADADSYTWDIALQLAVLGRILYS